MRSFFLLLMTGCKHRLQMILSQNLTCVWTWKPPFSKFIYSEVSTLVVALLPQCVVKCFQLDFGEGGGRPDHVLPLSDGPIPPPAYHGASAWFLRACRGSSCGIVVEAHNKMTDSSQQQSSIKSVVLLRLTSPGLQNACVAESLMAEDILFVSVILYQSFFIVKQN